LGRDNSDELGCGGVDGEGFGVIGESAFDRKDFCAGGKIAVKYLRLIADLDSPSDSAFSRWFIDD
jgi:hypothetical protein